MKGIVEGELIKWIIVIGVLVGIIAVFLVNINKISDQVLPAGCPIGQVTEPCPCNGVVVRPSMPAVYCCQNGIVDKPC